MWSPQRRNNWKLILGTLVGLSSQIKMPLIGFLFHQSKPEDYRKLKEDTFINKVDEKLKKLWLYFFKKSVQSKVQQTLSPKIIFGLVIG